MVPSTMGKFVMKVASTGEISLKMSLPAVVLLPTGGKPDVCVELEDAGTSDPVTIERIKKVFFFKKT